MDKVKIWIENTSGKIKQELLEQQNDTHYINEIFSTNLKFGTAGLRAKMSAGSCRLNEYTIAHATQAISQFINENTQNKTVVIGYDGRNNSRLFAEKTAQVLHQNGVKTILFSDMVATPVLSYATRKLGCFMGIMITASHNPPEYNGYKVYNQFGAQISVEVAEKIMNIIDSIDIFADIEKADYNEQNHTHIFDEIFESYTDEVVKNSFHPIENNIKVAYTPLSGVGYKFMQKVLEKRGFSEFFVVENQKNADGDFKNCLYPNPEYKPALDMGIELYNKQNADILIATDPDADRVGAYIDGEYFTGNQIGVLMCDYLLKHRKNISKDDVIMSTIVSTNMILKIAKNYGVKSIRTLPGFKYIGHYLTENGTKNYVLGFEESMGYHFGDYTLDKDGILSSMILIEMTSFYKKQGKNLLDILDDMYEKYGYYIEKVVNYNSDRVDFKQEFEEIMKKFAKTEQVLGLQMKKDYGKENILEFENEQINLIIRPSGTEPKIKFYISACDQTLEKSKHIVDDFSKKILTEVENI